MVEALASEPGVEIVYGDEKYVRLFGYAVLRLLGSDETENGDQGDPESEHTIRDRI